jgi:arylformamidase
MPFLDVAGHVSWVFLSHVLGLGTPAYGNAAGLTIEVAHSIDSGDSSNSVELKFSNHLGTHVDAPRHFIADGKSVEQYRPDDWIFSKVFVADVLVDDGGIVDVPRLESALKNVSDVDLLLVRTGFERKRGSESYWAASPGFDPSLCGYLQSRFPSLSAIGMDTISISSMMHRDMGRSAHRVFLSAGIRIFEDMSLVNAKQVDRVVAMPLRLADSDGAPCTVIGMPQRLLAG